MTEPTPPVTPAPAPVTPEKKVEVPAVVPAVVAAPAQPEPTPTELHDAAIAAVEAWQAKPEDTALKDVAKAATAKAKEAADNAKKAAAVAAEKNKAPEKYELKAPEKSPLSQADLERIAAEAKAQGLTNEAAQKLVERDHSLLAARAVAEQKQLETIWTGWIETAKADPELGGEKLTAAAEGAKRVVEKYGSEKLKEDLKITRYGDHPELLRLLSRIYKEMGEDHFVAPNAQNPGTRKSNEEVLFGATSNGTAK